MEQLKSKEYTSIAKLMRGFLEEIELVPYSELPSPQEIVKELKRRRYLENGITAQQLGCAEDGDQVVFVHYSPKKPPEDLPYCRSYKHDRRKCTSRGPKSADY